jgi:hypothetical protein
MDIVATTSKTKAAWRRNPVGGLKSSKNLSNQARLEAKTSGSEQFNELDSLRVLNDAYADELEEFKKILGPEFVAQETFRVDEEPTNADTQMLDQARERDHDIANAYLRHGKKTFGDKVGVGGDAKEHEGAGPPRVPRESSVALSHFFADPDPERKNIERAMELNVRLQNRMDQLMESNNASLKEHDALEARMNDVEREKRQKLKDLEFGTWRFALGQLTMEYQGGQSWFFKGATYANTRAFLNVAKHLMLVSKSGEWSQEERDSLARGVVEMAEERWALEMMDRVEYLEDFVELQRGRGPQNLSCLLNIHPSSGVDGSDASDVGTTTAAGILIAPPNNSSHVDEVIAEADAMTLAEWNTLAWRHVAKRTGKDCMLQWQNAVKPTLRRGPFSDDEKKRLRQLVKRHGDHAEAWEIISQRLQGRTPLACLQEHVRESKVASARIREKERRIGNLCFTEDDVRRVRQLVLKHGQSWKKIAKEFGGSWTPQQIMFEWRKHLQSTGGGVVVAKKGKWSKDEDDKLVKAVAVIGRQWAKVAQHVPGRTEMQVRERYVNHLDPEVESNQPFTADELELVKREVPNNTNPKSGRISWAKVARMLPSRTDRQVKKAYERLSREASREKKKGRAKKRKNPWDDGEDYD